MSGLKLLGIRPLKGCHPDYLKVFEEDEIYQFYNNYEFVKVENDSDGYEVTEIIESTPIPQGLYDQDGLNINISAVVGKNGSGKSTLIELLYYAIYSTGTYLKILDSYAVKLNKKLESYYYNGIAQMDDDTIEKLNETISAEDKAHFFILDNFKVSIFYQKNGGFFELIVDKNLDKRITLYKVDSGNRIVVSEQNLLKSFFYTIAINYSHYALNSNKIGNWISALFHKNDAYKTPVVINPMRVEGNFNINDEIDFATYRLLHNLLNRQSENSKGYRISITDKQHVQKIRFRLNSEKTSSKPIKQSERGLKIDATNLKAANLLLDLQSVFYQTYEQADILNSDLPFKSEIDNYVVRKVEKITETYEEYYDQYNFDEVPSQERNILFLENLKEDGSHITFKLKQALNFLRINLALINETEDTPWLHPETDDIGSYFDFTLDELYKWICVKNDNTGNIIDFLPPSIFSIEILLGNKSDQVSLEPTNSFSALSSGEQQLIHSIQSVLYHLNNLESSHKSNSKVRKVYDSVNIIYDEIELYFHPDYQRKFVSELLKSIKTLKLGGTFGGIKNLNIVFSTHSPFILSDIPSQNIMRLKINEQTGKTVQILSEKQTFGANIHELLSDSFFMGSTIGSNVQEKIKEIIDLYYDIRRADYNDRVSLIEAYLGRKEEYRWVVDNIGEEVVRNVLNNHLDYIDEVLMN